LQRRIIIKTKYIILLLVAVITLLSVSCSPVDRVKWSDVNLLGNDLPVWRIVRGLSGSNGSVEWAQDTQGINQDCDIVSVKISRKSQQFVLRFSYDRKKDECRLIEYRVNGKPESPFYIYKFMNVTRYRFLPGFVDYFFDPAAGH